jgi:hypothetical protein
MYNRLNYNTNIFHPKFFGTKIIIIIIIIIIIHVLQETKS